MSKSKVKETQYLNSATDTNQSLEDVSKSPSRTIEDNAVARVRTTKRKTNPSEKKSTGCGPSPPKELEAPKSFKEPETKHIETSTTETNMDSKKVDKKRTTSTGTSPLPQSISTQVCSQITCIRQKKKK